MKHLSVAASIEIDRPMFLVRQQFSDVAHHARTHPHRGVRFTEVDDDGRVCRYRQTTRLGPIRLRQDLRLERRTDGPLVNTIDGGQFAGGSITFDFAELAPGCTRVMASVDVPLTGPRALFAPALRSNIRRTLERALHEDKADLEQGDYRPTAH